MNLTVLYEDNHLLVVDKPAGLPTMGVSGEPSLHSVAADYLRVKYNKPGNVYVGIVSRLDRLTSGVIVVARTSKAAARLSAQFARRDDRSVEKSYLAVVQGYVAQDSATWIASVVKDEPRHRMIISKNDPNAKEAILRYEVLRRVAEQTLVRVELLTGRKHQIRLQFSDKGHPVLGDRKYGSNANWSDGIALHSWKLSFKHPTLGHRLNFTVPPPKTWRVVGPIDSEPRV